VTRDELLRRTNHKTPEQKGWEYLRQLYGMTVIFFVVYFGFLGTVLFWNYPDVTEVETEILEHVEMYLGGDGYFSRPFSEPYKNVKIGVYKIQKDYWATLRSGCSGGGISRRTYKRCSVNFTFKVFLSYQADGKTMSGMFQIVYSSGKLEIVPKELGREFALPARAKLPNVHYLSRV
jgi:hypothetical protein